MWFDALGRLLRDSGNDSRHRVKSHGGEEFIEVPAHNRFALFHAIPPPDLLDAFLGMRAHGVPEAAIQTSDRIRYSRRWRRWKRWRVERARRRWTRRRTTRRRWRGGEDEEEMVERTRRRWRRWRGLE